MIVRTKKEDIDKYFASTNLNQSAIKKIIGPLGRLKFMDLQNQSGKQLYYEEKGHFIIGNGVDQMFSDPKEFDNLYHYAEIKKPGDSILSLAHIIYDSFNQTDIPTPNLKDDHFKMVVHEALKNIDYYNKDAKEDFTKDSRMGRLEKGGLYEYLEALFSARGKQVIDLKEKLIIDKIYQSMTTSYVTKELFEDKSKCTIHYQVPLYFEYRGFQCKILIDRLEINHADKTIQIDDWKTMSDLVINFLNSLKDRRYDIQIGWYKLGVEKAIINSGSGKYKDYIILPPRFIVESTTYPGTPMIYTMSDEILYIAKYGKEAKKVEFIDIDDRTLHSQHIPAIWGYDRCIDEIIWYNENGWETDRLYVETGGNLIIDWTKIINI